MKMKPTIILQHYQLDLFHLVQLRLNTSLTMRLIKDYLQRTIAFFLLIIEGETQETIQCALASNQNEVTLDS